MIVKVTSYIRPGKAAKPRAKATLRYVTHRPNAEGERVTRALFGADGPYAKDQVYTLIDRSPKGSFYYRTVFSPDPALEDEFKNLNLWEMMYIMIPPTPKLPPTLRLTRIFVL